MALPSAQLGSLPSLGLPSTVPVQQVEKRTPLWQQLLGQILMQTAGGVVNQGVQNSMSRDFAGDYKEAPSSGVDKFMHGPKVSQAEDVRRKGQAFDTDKMLAQAKMNIGLAELGDQPGAREVYARQTADSAASDRRQADMQDTIAKSRLSRREQGHADEREVAHEMFATQLEQARQKGAQDLKAQEILGDKPFTDARVGSLLSQTKGQDMTNTLLERAVNGGKTPSTVPTKGLTSFAAGSGGGEGTPVGPSVQPPAPSDQTTIQQLMASGLSPEEIIAQLQQVKMQTEMTQQGEAFDRLRRNQSLSSQDQLQQMIMRAVDPNYVSPADRTNAALQAIP